MVFTSITLHYFDYLPGKKTTAALGENIHLLLKDAGLDYTYIRHKNDEWPTIKQDMVENKHIFGPTMPFIEIDGFAFNKTVPAMRYISKQLGKYRGKDDKEEYELDAVADITRDYWNAILPVFMSTDEQVLANHQASTTRKYLEIFERVYAARSTGPYILGEDLSYADILIYHLLDDDNAFSLLEEYPHIATFVQAFTHRPNLVDYFASSS
ncbi:class gamma glutathione S-transferase [Halteromyces radiatus]|uniref:class gamma glutathione S-transferase n=1 Tax=Halteromyces radiatus TaxID=101107 RepID=UPI002220BD2F|nr:class gamma glutathione S-transferase [Halteromyces radiatus]KAI8092644.1 class gamma glutathione S-transferase [Halteromyces radiatus]